jgi:hypothetical protein
MHYFPDVQGSVVAHFLERDDSLQEDPYGTLLVLQPAVPLRNNAHYVVGVRRLVSSSSPTLAPKKMAVPAQYFIRMRDGRPADPNEANRLEQFERDVFPAIKKIGWQRGELQLAWDLRTASWESGPGEESSHLLPRISCLVT